MYVPILSKGKSGSLNFLNTCYYILYSNKHMMFFAISTVSNTQFWPQYYFLHFQLTKLMKIYSMFPVLIYEFHLVNLFFSLVKASFDMYEMSSFYRHAQIFINFLINLLTLSVHVLIIDDLGVIMYCRFLSSDHWSKQHIYCLYINYLGWTVSC